MGECDSPVPEMAQAILTVTNPPFSLEMSLMLAVDSFQLQRIFLHQRLHCFGVVYVS